MVNGVKLFQSFLRDMGVDLRRGNIAVTEQQLHDTQIRAVIEKMRRECVSQAMR